jgi:hypothetical protein
MTTHYDIAKILHNKWCNEFKSGKIRHNDWHQFVENQWIKVDVVLLYDKLNELINEYNKLFHECHLLMIKVEGYERDILKNKRNNYAKIAKKLNGTVFKRNVMKECCKLFYDPNFK